MGKKMDATAGEPTISTTEDEPNFGSTEDKPSPGPANQAKLVSPPSPPEEFFVDGVSGFTARGGVIKIDLYKVVGVEDNTELRTISHRMILPNIAMNELAELLRQVTEAANKAREAQADSVL